MRGKIEEWIRRLKEEVYPLVEDKVSLEEFEAKVKKWALIIPNYNELKRKLMQDLGVYMTAETQRKKISEIEDGDRRLEVIGKILGVREIVTERGKYYVGVLADETGSISFRAYLDTFPYKSGENIRIVNAYARSGPSGLMLYITQNTIIERYKEEIYVVEAGKKRIMDLKDGMFGVEVEALVLKIKRRINEGKGPKIRGLLCDATGKIAFSSWVDLDLNEGDMVRIVGASVQSFRGIPVLMIDQYSQIEKLYGGEIYCVSSETLYDIAARGGGLDVSVQGLIVDVKQGSGLIKRCEKCGRILKEGGICPEHGKVKGFLDLRARVVIDDGTGALLAIINREALEKILGETLEDLVNKAKEDIEFGTGYSYIKEKLFGKYVTASGNILPGRTGLVFLVDSIEENTISQMSEKLSKILEELS